MYLRSLGITGSKVVQPSAAVRCWWSRLDGDPLSQTPHVSCISSLGWVVGERSVSQCPTPLTSALCTDKPLVSCTSKRFHHQRWELPRNFMSALNSVKEVEKN